MKLTHLVPCEHLTTHHLNCPIVLRFLPRVYVLQEACIVHVCILLKLQCILLALGCCILCTQHCVCYMYIVSPIASIRNLNLVLLLTISGAQIIMWKYCLQNFKFVAPILGAKLPQIFVSFLVRLCIPLPLPLPSPSLPPPSL